MFVCNCILKILNTHRSTYDLFHDALRLYNSPLLNFHDCSRPGYHRFSEHVSVLCFNPEWCSFIEELQRCDTAVNSFYTRLYYCVFISVMWNELRFISPSGELWMKAHLRHLRKSSVNRWETFLLQNPSEQLERGSEQVQHEFRYKTRRK